MQRDPASPRRPPMAQSQYNPPPNAPPPRPYFHGGAQDPRYRPSSPAQQYANPTSPTRYAESIVSDAGSEQWPLPPRPVGQPGSRSSSPRKARPPRDQHQRPPSAQSRQYYRSRPPGPYQRGPPRHSHASVHSQTSHQGHPSAQWRGEGYNGPPPPGHGPPYARRPSHPRPPQGPPMAYAPQPPYHKSRKPRYPPLVPVPQRDLGGYSTESPITPAESLPDANWPLDLNGVNDSLLTPTSVTGARVKIPSYYFGDKDADTESPVAASIDENHDSPMESQTNSERESREEQRLQEPPAPIRQASLGKKSKPTLMTVTTGERRKSSADSTADPPSMPQSQSSEPPSDREHLTDFEEELDALPGAWISEGPTPDEHRDQDQASEHESEVALAISADEVLPDNDATSDDDEGASDPRRSSHLLGPPGLFADPAPLQPFDAFEMQRQLRPDSEEDFPFKREETPEEEDREVPLSPIMDTAQPVEDEHDEPVSPIEPEDFLSPMEAHMDRSEKRRTRPASLDIEAIRDAESRGSMTSLPDLIRRATKLRTNLDRGKTASRLGMNFFNTSDTDVDVEKYRANARHSGSSADLLSSPGYNNEARKSLGNFSAMLRLSRIPSTDPAAEKEMPTKEPRKYCGMPLWLCLVLLVLVLLLIAAAIVIPVVLLVIPKQHSTHSGSSNHLTALEQCKANLSCQNSGLNIITKSSPCSCLCVNGYTGRTCTEKPSSGCGTMAISNTDVEATIGEDVKSLLETANQNYNIPLSTETLLGLFSSADLTCAAENSLVSFTTGTKKTRRSPVAAPARRDSHSHDHDRTNTRTKVHPRSSSASPSSPSGSSPASASASASQPSSSAIGPSQDFAGVAVLYVLQETGKQDSAIEAQHNLQSFFAESQQSNPFNVSLGNGFSVNLPKRTLVWTLGNGTVVAN